MKRYIYTFGLALLLILFYIYGYRMPWGGGDGSPLFNTQRGEATVSDKMTEIRVGGVSLKVELATTPEEHAEGLMLRKELSEDNGMLFIYPSPRILTFWMKDTYIPLDIAFIDKDKTIVSIQHMKPLDDKHLYVSPSPVLYALEVNQGWFNRNGVEIGDRMEFVLPSLRRMYGK